MNTELHIFTNCTVNAPSTAHIDSTYKSFIERFGEMKTIVWCDPNPNKKYSSEYIQKLNDSFDTVHSTKSLSNGWIRAVNESESDYMFMIEHDWLFLDTIEHSVEQIINGMINDDLYYLRFNKRENIVKGLDVQLEEKDNGIYKYCSTTSMSNNPQIINTNMYKETILPLIRESKGSNGIEDVLYHNHKNVIYGNIYGPLNYPATVKHTDGRRRNL
jgi:hypothetical protein